MFIGHTADAHTYASPVILNHFITGDKIMTSLSNMNIHQPKNIGIATMAFF
jgi:hypothetical protein